MIKINNNNNNNNNNNSNSNSKKPRKYTKALCNFFYELTSLTRDVIKAHL